MRMRALSTVLFAALFVLVPVTARAQATWGPGAPLTITFEAGGKVSFATEKIVMDWDDISGSDGKCPVIIKDETRSMQIVYLGHFAMESVASFTSYDWAINQPADLEEIPIQPPPDFLNAALFRPSGWTEVTWPQIEIGCSAPFSADNLTQLGRFFAMFPNLPSEQGPILKFAITTWDEDGVWSQIDPRLGVRR